MNGWHTAPVTVGFTATDETSLFLVDGRASRTASHSVTTTRDGELALESPAFTDRAGNASAIGAVKRTVKVDTTAPSAPTAAVSTPAGATGWHTAPVTVTFDDAGDAGSGVASCTAPVTVDVDTAGKTVSGTCTDRAGHVSAAKEVTVKLDRGAPVVTQAVAAAPTGATAGTPRDVAVDFTATDAVSASPPPPSAVTSSGEGAAVEVASPAFTDRAGNTTAAGAVKSTFKVDKTRPSAALSTPRSAGSYVFGSVPAAPTCTAGDTGSGVATCEVSGDGTAVGTHTVNGDGQGQRGTRDRGDADLHGQAWTANGFTSRSTWAASSTPSRAAAPSP